MVIEQNTVVLCHYTLREGTASGQLIESTEGGEPLGYIHGIGTMIPLFEQNLEGKSSGDSFEFGIPAAEAYGEYDDESVAEIPKAAFNLGDMNPDDVFVEGEVLPLQDENGNMMQGIIAQVNPTTVTIDFNHPMAGVDLYFIGQIADVRHATPEELAHQHVHGVGGHHH
ncbi:MAG: peptidylprolyl isomerase [Saprospiraceae bacterium]|nr:peptidylprolyl isomerase [Saprospiraceae bacterium]